MDKHTEHKISFKKYHSVSFRLPILFAVSCMIIVLIFVGMLYFRFKSRMIEEYAHIAAGATSLMALELDGDKIDEYLEKNFEMEEYNRILTKFYGIRDSYRDIVYLYVYRLAPDGGTIIFDLNSLDGTEDAGEPGEHYEFSDDFMVYMDDLLKGIEVQDINGETEDGYLLTYCKPIYDSNGVLQCHACVDFSMDELRRKDLNFIISILLVTGISAVLIMFFGIYRIKKEVTEPLNKMSQATEQFAYQTQEDQANNIQLMKKLNIRTDNEIGHVYSVFISVMEQNLSFMKNLSRAQTVIKVRDEQIGQISQEAYRDALTGVGSKAAYTKKVDEMRAAVEHTDMQFAIVMIDMNDLKKINDEFGHKAGDLYLRGCCHAACQIFKHSPVFRVGGDEFVVILTGDDYQNRAECIEKLRAAYEEAYANTDADPWLRYSASIGIAERTDSSETMDSVLKRADEAMYADKKAFKEKHGSYR